MISSPLRLQNRWPDEWKKSKGSHSSKESSREPHDFVTSDTQLREMLDMGSLTFRDGLMLPEIYFKREW